MILSKVARQNLERKALVQGYLFPHISLHLHMHIG